jgi:uncharacterized protein YjbI with pentapeptide repeats
MSKTPRFGSDGSQCEDVTANPKAIARRAIEQAEKTREEAEARSPWTRNRVIAAISSIAQRNVLSHDGMSKARIQLNLHGVDLSGLDLSGLDLSRANLDSAKLSGANLNGCRLVGANLHVADLTGAILDGVNAVEANLHGACLCKARVANTHFMKANLSEVCHDGTDGLDITEKPLTAAEDTMARRKQSEGFRVHIAVDEGVVRYYGATLEGANVTGLSAKCKRVE